MDQTKRSRLERAGWRVGSAEDFLQLSPEEAQLVEVRLALSEGVRVQRERAGLTQQELAERVGSSQSRVSKMEAGDASVSMDLLVRSMFAAGASKRDLAAVIRGRRGVV